MYKRDNKKIAEFILKDADNTVIGITFVLGTIQNALSNVGKFMDGVVLFSFKIINIILCLMA